MKKTAWVISQDVSLETAVNWGKGWTSEELEFLAEFPEVPTLELAEAMGRTVYAVSNVRQALERGEKVGSVREKPREKREIVFDFVTTFPLGWDD